MKENNMMESDIKFEKLIIEMEKLVIERVPILENAITILSNQEKNQGVFNYEEIQKKETELDILRKTYIQILDDLMKLNHDKAKLRVKEIIKTKKELDVNYTRDLREANQGSSVKEFFQNLPI